MKKLNDYFWNKASMFVVFSISFLLFSFILFIIDLFAINTTIEIKILLMKIYFFISFFMALFLTTNVKQSRHNDIFWQQADKVLGYITDATTVQELEDLKNINIQNLRTLAVGNSNLLEINRLKSMIDIKIDTIEKIWK